MREKILNALNISVETFGELSGKYSHVLPGNIIDGSINTFEHEIPKHINNFLDILNMAEQEEVFKSVKTIHQAIDVFNNANMDSSIEKAINNNTIIGAGMNGNLSAKQLLESSEFGIISGVQLLSMQLKAGKLSNGEF